MILNDILGVGGIYMTSLYKNIAKRIPLVVKKAVTQYGLETLNIGVLGDKELTKKSQYAVLSMNAGKIL